MFCNKKEIVSELIALFGDNATYKNWDDDHEYDKTGDSKTYNTTFSFKSHNDIVRVSIYDWSKKLTAEKGFPDNLKVSIVSERYMNFINKDVYN